MRRKTQEEIDILEHVVMHNFDANSGQVVVSARVVALLIEDYRRIQARLFELEDSDHDRTYRPRNNALRMYSHSGAVLPDWLDSNNFS